MTWTTRGTTETASITGTIGGRTIDVAGAGTVRTSDHHHCQPLPFVSSAGARVGTLEVCHAQVPREGVVQQSKESKGCFKKAASSRADAVAKAIAGVGGQMESFYFAFGSDDVYVIADLPDNTAAIALAATVGATGTLSDYETVVLLTPQEIDAAVRQSVDYRPPGG